MGEKNIQGNSKRVNSWCLSKLILLNVQNNLLIVKNLYVDVLFFTVLRIAIVHQLNLCCLKHWKYITGTKSLMKEDLVKNSLIGAFPPLVFCTGFLNKRVLQPN